MENLHLKVAGPERNNFLIEGGNNRKKTEVKGDKNKSRTKTRDKERKRFSTRQALERIQNQQKGIEEKGEEPRFNWVRSFKLLGVVLGSKWKFEQHLEEAKAKAMERLAALTEVGNAVWGMESRILSATAHSLVESVVSYGLATTGKGWGNEGPD